MKKLFAYCLFLGIVTALFLSCSKDKFTTIPQIEIKEISPDIVVSGDLIRFKSVYTDQEGDIDSIILVKKYFNGATATLIDTIDYYSFDLFNLPKNSQTAEINITFEYGTNNTNFTKYTPMPETDTTLAFGIILLDKAKHRSEYKESSQIRLIKP